MEEKAVNKMDYPHDSNVCKGEVKETTTFCECSNTKYPYPGYAKIPMVLGEFTVQIDVESKIKLDEPAIEIKRIKKNLYLTQCRLIAGTCKLFLKGFVRKNIEYATKDFARKDVLCGDIKHTTVYVPFECVTKVDLNKYPKLHVTPGPCQIDYFDKCTLGKDMKEHDLISSEYFNEKVYCELEKAKIYEADIAEECCKLDCHPVEMVFQTFIEKEVICLTIKLLQNQQIYYPLDGDCKKIEVDPSKEDGLIEAELE